MADVGSILGLWIGISLMSFLEVFLFILDLLVLSLAKIYHIFRSRDKTGVNSNISNDNSTKTHTFEGLDSKPITPHSRSRRLSFFRRSSQPMIHETASKQAKFDTILENKATKPSEKDSEVNVHYAKKGRRPSYVLDASSTKISKRRRSRVLAAKDLTQVG